MGMCLEDIGLIFRESPSVLSVVKYARMKLYHEVSERVLERNRSQRALHCHENATARPSRKLRISFRGMVLVTTVV